MRSSTELNMNMRYRQLIKRWRTAGMSLIELMIVVAIIGILAAIAYPSYQRHIGKTSRKAATACLSQYANFMERYYTSNLNYDIPNWPSLGCSTEGDMARFYSFPAATVGDELRTYTISAVPTTLQAARDPDSCGTLTLNQAGARSPTTNACW
ncbi:MAG TPA: type IV pilin protein [Steroidobacter sp.]